MHNTTLKAVRVCISVVHMDSAGVTKRLKEGVIYLGVNVVPTFTLHTFLKVSERIVTSV
jgi:hypothetical protein